MTTIANDGQAAEDPFIRMLMQLVPQFRAYSVYMTGDMTKANILAAEAFKRALALRETLPEEAAMRVWAFSILHGVYREIPRKKHRIEPTPELASRIGPTLGPFLEACLDLPEQNREVLVLYSGSDFKYEEIAKICGCPLGTVRSRMHRGRAEIAEMFLRKQTPEAAHVPA